MKKIHHISLVTNDVELALKTFNLTKSDIKETYVDAYQKNRLYFIYFEQNDLWFEIVEPIDKNSTTYNFAQKMGLGLHHLGIATDNLELTEKEYTERPFVYKIGNYTNNVKSFGGEISTVFVAIKGLILEFVANVKKK